MNKNRAKLRRLAALTLALALLLSQAACRESPVLHEVIYQQQAPETDPEQEMLDPEDQGQEDEQFDQQQKEDADTERDSQEDMGLDLPEETPPPAEPEASLETDYSPDAGNDWQAEQSAGEPDSGQEGSGEASEPPAGPGSEAESGAGTEEESGGEEEPEPVPGDETSLRQVVDASGRLVELPENVETVTAVRWAAQMTEVLGGSGRLLAADSEFLSSPLAAAAFSDLGGVQCLWYGSGSSGITDDNFAALLALEPDVCFTISGEYSFSSAQLQQLEEAGIACVVLPALKSQETLRQAVELVAQVLGGNRDTGESAADIAGAYVSWMNDVAGRAGDKVSADCTSLYIADWDSGAAYTLNYTKGVIEAEGSGLAMAYSPKRAQLVSTFLKAAGVVNESTRIMSTHRDADYVYVAPMFHQFDPAVSGTRAAFYSGAGEYGSAFDLFVSRMISDTVYYQLGSAQYPAVIAANAQVKANLEGNWFWQYHESDANGYVNISGESFYCGIVGQYRVLVNPQGMCSWAEGSLESPLEALWATYAFGGDLTLEEVKEETAGFYQRFFGLALTEKHLEEIFGE